MLVGVKETYRLLRAGKMGDSDVWGLGHRGIPGGGVYGQLSVR